MKWLQPVNLLQLRPVRKRQQRPLLQRYQFVVHCKMWKAMTRYRTEAKWNLEYLTVLEICGFSNYYLWLCCDLIFKGKAGEDDVPEGKAGMEGNVAPKGKQVLNYDCIKSMFQLGLIECLEININKLRLSLSGLICINKCSLLFLLPYIDYYCTSK